MGEKDGYNPEVDPGKKALKPAPDVKSLGAAAVKGARKGDVAKAAGKAAVDGKKKK